MGKNVTPFLHENFDQFFDQLLAEKQRNHTYSKFKKVTRRAGAFPHALQEVDNEKHNDNIEQRDIVVWCNNDWLGMSRHPRVIEAARESALKHGTSASGSRTCTGNSPLHEQLEQTLARLHGKEAGLVFSSAFVANDATLYTLSRMLPGKCQIFYDAASHISMKRGFQTAQAETHVFRHNDVQHLDELLTTYGEANRPKIVIWESVHSMDGSICPLEEMCDITRKHNALSFVDEVGAIGVFGEHGAGIGEVDKCAHKIDVVSGTLGKGYGNVGGYIAGSRQLVDFVRCHAEAFMFTTALPPTVLGGALEAVNILASEEGQELRKRLFNRVDRLRSALKAVGLPVIDSPSHFIPVRIGDAQMASYIMDELLERGHYVQPIGQPYVAKGSELLRMVPTPFHTDEMIENLAADMADVYAVAVKSFRATSNGIADNKTSQTMNGAA